MESTPPALLLHGQPGSASDWDWVLRALGDRLTARAITRPGYDGTPAGGIRHSAERALAELDRAGLDRVIAVGHSYGGAVAAWLASFHPDRIAGLVLVSAAANRDALVPGDRWLAAPVIGPLASAGLLWSAGVMSQIPAIRRRIAATAELPVEFMAAEGRRNLRRSTRRTFVTEQRWMLREMPELEDQLGRIRTPTRVLVGANDVFVPPRAGRRLAEQIPGAELIEIPRAGHVLNVQHPTAVVDAILAVAQVG